MSSHSSQPSPIDDYYKQCFMSTRGVSFNHKTGIKSLKQGDQVNTISFSEPDINIKLCNAVDSSARMHITFCNHKDMLDINELVIGSKVSCVSAIDNSVVM